jgi:hypothetical protein
MNDEELEQAKRAAAFAGELNGKLMIREQNTRKLKQAIRVVVEKVLNEEMRALPPKVRSARIILETAIKKAEKDEGNGSSTSNE